MKMMPADGISKPSWELTAIKYATSQLPEKMAFAGGREDVAHSIVFVIYCIRAGEKLILVDPGCDTLPGFEMQDFVLPVDALHKNGIAPETVTDIIITHAHYDHIDAVRHFPGSTVHIQKEEYAAGRQYIPDSCPVNVFEESTLVAPGIRVQRSGGHTAGSSIVLLTDKDTTWVLCGDECYLSSNLSRQIPIGTSKNPEASRAFLEEYAKAQYRVLICHDPENLQKEFANGSIIGV